MKVKHNTAKSNIFESLNEFNKKADINTDSTIRQILGSSCLRKITDRKGFVKLVRDNNNYNEKLLTNIVVLSDDEEYFTQIEKTISQPKYSLFVRLVRSVEELKKYISENTLHILYIDFEHKKYEEPIYNLIKHINDISKSTSIVVSLHTKVFNNIELQRHESKLLANGVERVLRKPFLTSLLISNLDLALKKVRGCSNYTHRIGPITFILDKPEVLFYHIRLNLTSTQFLIVYLLFIREKKIVKKEDIIDMIQKGSENEIDNDVRKSLNKSLDVAICKIRSAFANAKSKIEKTPGFMEDKHKIIDIGNQINTIWCGGYVAYVTQDDTENEDDNKRCRSQLRLNDGISVSYTEEQIAKLDEMVVVK